MFESFVVGRDMLPDWFREMLSDGRAKPMEDGYKLFVPSGVLKALPGDVVARDEYGVACVSRHGGEPQNE